LFRPLVPKEAITSIAEVLQSGWIGEGPRVAKFEALLCAFIGNPYILALNSGTSALVLALRLAGIRPGDEVISSPMTCVATNEAILLAGGRVVWADVDPLTGNINPQSIIPLVTRKTKAIMAVHWGGNPCDISGLHSIADHYNLTLIEDAAHALGAEFGGRPIGQHSQFTCFSFQAVKMLTTGDGGALACTSRKVWRTGKLLRWFGIERGKPVGTYDVASLGYKFHMNDIAAAIGIAGFHHLEARLETTTRNARLYDSALSGIDGIRPCSVLPMAKPSYWLYTVLVKSRTAFIRTLREHSIETSVVHLRNDDFSLFKGCRSYSLDGVRAFDRQHVCLPVGPWVTPEDVASVVDIIGRGW
jgi:dTDP-4-amino-4,6-dideoxygalactose transaminase